MTRASPKKPARPSARPEPWFVYLLRCADGTFYAGIARDVPARVAAHADGRGAKYTRGRGPLEVVAVRRCVTKGDALRLELAVKRLRREDKVALASKRRFRALAARVLAAARSTRTARARGSSAK